MRLKVLTPTQVILDREVAIVVAEGRDGSFALEPRHVDFVSALLPGLLQYRAHKDDDGQYVAVDRGVLVKQGLEVLVSVRKAVHGVPIERLVEVVHTQFLVLDDQEKTARAAMARLESNFVRRFMEVQG